MNTLDLDIDEPVAVDVSPSITVSNTKTLSRDDERLVRMGQVVSKFASTLCLRPIQVHVDNDTSAPAPAWSDADNIWFAKHKLGKLIDPKVITAVKGLSLHEISHILLTPRVGSNLGTWVRQNSLWRAFNALEDMRIESMMTAKYPSVSEWLIATIAQHLLAKPNQYTVCYPLIYGRKYLPQDMRDAIAQVYEDNANVKAIADVIDQYIMLNLADPKECAIAQPLIKEYNDLVNKLEPTMPDYPQTGGWSRIQDPNGHDQRKDGELKSSSTSKPLSKSEQQDIIDRMKRNQQAQGDKQDGNGADAPITSPADYGDGAGQYDGPPMSSTTLQDIIQDALDTAMDRLDEDIEHTLKQFNGEAGLTSNSVPSPPRAESIIKDVEYDAVVGSKSFGNELELLKGEYDPAWDRRQDSGRLNVQRYATGCDVEEAFDRWELGREDAVDIECVVLLDTSPSMSWTIHKAYDNMWAIKRALDKINASTTVVTFDDKARVLYSADERATFQKRDAGMGGGTEPLKALKYAKYVLAESTRSIKVLITITDGAWSQSQECDTIIRQLRKGGVLTSLAFVDDTDWWNERFVETYGENYRRSSKVTIDSHGCEVAVLVNEASDLFKLAKKLVKVGINRNLASV